MALMSKCLLSADCQLESTYVTQSRQPVFFPDSIPPFLGRHSPGFQPGTLIIFASVPSPISQCPLVTESSVLCLLPSPSLLPSFSFYCTCFGMFGPTVCPRWSLFCACSSVTVLRTSLVKDSSACTFSLASHFLAPCQNSVHSAQPFCSFTVFLACISSL